MLRCGYLLLGVAPVLQGSNDSQWTQQHVRSGSLQQNAYSPYGDHLDHIQMVWDNVQEHLQGQVLPLWHTCSLKGFR